MAIAWSPELRMLAAVGYAATVMTSINRPDSCGFCGQNYDGCDFMSSSCHYGLVVNSSFNGCHKCPIGLEPNLNQTLCLPCPPGKSRHSTEYSFCIDCPLGAICDNKNITCHSGRFFYFNGSVARCDLCPEGTFKPSAGNHLCSTCPIGTESALNRTICTPCPSRKTRPSLPFSGGAICNSTDIKVSGYQCSPNNAHSSANLFACIDCPINVLICNATHVLCLPGYQLAINQSACLQCPNGFINPVGELSQCIKCPLGKQSNENRTECVTCPDGTFKPLEVLSSCIDCPVGAKCTPTNLTCLAGYEKSHNVSYECNQCSQDYFKPNDGDYNCIKCPVGTYSSDDYSQCFNCPSGYAMSISGSCTRCGPGREPIFNRTMCIDCPPGKYKPTDLHDICLKCPIGATCSTLEFTCNAGYYLFGGTGCRRCSAGTYKPTIGNLLECDSCPAGTQSNHDRTACDPCPNGQYRPPGSPHPFCINCPLFYEVCSSTSFTCKSGYMMNPAKDGCDIEMMDSAPTVISTLANLSINLDKNDNSQNNMETMTGMYIIYGTAALAGLMVMIFIGIAVKRVFLMYYATPYDKSVTNNYTFTASVEHLNSRSTDCDHQNTSV